VQVNVLVCAKVFGDWDAVKVLADLAVVNRCYVEEEEEADEKERHGRQADPDQNDLLPSNGEGGDICNGTRYQLKKYVYPTLLLAAIEYQF
jgi:hypothetical protein